MVECAEHSALVFLIGHIALMLDNEHCAYKQEGEEGQL